MTLLRGAATFIFVNNIQEGGAFRQIKRCGIGSAGLGHHKTLLVETRGRNKHDEGENVSLEFGEEGVFSEA